MLQVRIDGNQLTVIYRDVEKKLTEFVTKRLDNGEYIETCMGPKLEGLLGRLPMLRECIATLEVLVTTKADVITVRKWHGNLIMEEGTMDKRSKNMEVRTNKLIHTYDNPANFLMDGWRAS